MAIPLSNIPVIKAGENISELILKASVVSGIKIMDGDVLVIASKIVSKSEDRVIKASDVEV